MKTLSVLSQLFRVWSGLFQAPSHLSNCATIQAIRENEIAKHIAALEELGLVTEAIQPFKPGRVKYKGTWWDAVCLLDLVLPSDTQVRVISRANLTLIVEPFLITTGAPFTSKIASYSFASNASRN